MNESTKAIIKGGLRSIAASFPVAGSLGQAWSEYESHQRDQRTEEFFQNLKTQISGLEDKLKLVVEHIKTSGELPALLERTIEKVQREPSQSKRRLFAVALSMSLASGSAQTFDSKLSVIETLDGLTEFDLNTLKSLSSGRRMRVNELVPRSPFYLDEEGLGERISPLVVSLSKLESRGLIGETVPVNLAFDHPGEASHWANRWRRKTYEILPFGKKVLESIQELVLPAQTDANSKG